MARQQESGTPDERNPLQREIDRIEKDFGKGSIISSSTKPEKVDVISSGSLSLDRATGIGGFPRGGKIVEFIGWESSGKTTITLQTIANAQKLGLKCHLIDGEYSFDAAYARSLGVNVDDLLITQPDGGGGERCYDIAERMLKSRLIGLTVIDSQTSLLPKKQMQEDNGTSTIGLHARLMSTSVPKMLNAASMGNALVIYISQLREKVGVMFGSPETTSGGNALKFYAHMRVDFRKSVLREEGSKTEKGDAFANKTICTVIKNKLAPPFKIARFNINFGTGVDILQEYLEAAIELDVIKKSGSWYSFNEENLGQGEDTILEMMTDNPEFFERIRTLTLEKLKS